MRLRHIPNLFPELGLALHGTPYKNVPSIRREGISRRTPYICPLPHFNAQIAAGIEMREAVERTVGSVLFAQKYGHSTIPFGKRNMKSGDLPSVVILRGVKGGIAFTRIGYDEDVVQTRKKPPFKKYLSFGKEPVPPIPSSQIAAVVRVTRAEYAQLRKKVLDRLRKLGEPITRALLHDHLHSEIHGLLTRKTLKVVYELSRQGERPTP